MGSSPGRHSFRQLLRFYRYAAVHWRAITLAFVALAVSAMMNVAVLMLVKPAMEELEQRQATGVSEQEQVKVAPEDVLAEAEQKAESWVRQFGPVKAFSDWISAGDGLKKLALLLALIVGPLLCLSTWAYQYLHRRVVWHIMADIRMDVFQRLSSLSLSYFSHQRTGEIVSRLTNDMQSSTAALKLIFGKIVKQPLLLVGFLGVALASSWELTLITAACLPAIALLQRRYGRRIRRYSQKNLERLADITDSITQMLQGIRVVKSFDREEEENARFRTRTQAQLRRAFKLVRTRAWADVLPEFLLVLVLSGVFIMAGRLVATGELTVPSMLQCVAALAATGTPIRRIVKAYNSLQQSLAGVARMFELLDSTPEIQDHPDAARISGVEEGVRFEDVWFAYDEEPVLRGINLSVPAGKVYAIVGETGAGKTTMLDLIPRFYDVDQGSVSIDGIDVRRIERESLMEQIAIVGQHPFLFNRSIWENIRYGDPEADDEEVVAAARAANIHEFILSMPEGYDTLAGEMGDRFSGGQRQCITIARAILKNAPVLILDEATSSLDAQSEMLVRIALQNLMEGRTTFVIAHRLSTVRDAHRIVVLKAGRIIEQGSHEELLAEGGEYERLYRLQFFENPEEGNL